MKKKEDLKGFKIEDLKSKLTLLEESIRTLHFKAEGTKTKNTSEYSKIKKQIARILTEINNKKK